MLKQYLENLGIEYQDSSNYYTECPHCSSKRKKSTTKSLQVIFDGEYLRLKCYHSDQCKWNRWQFIPMVTSQDDSNIVNNKTLIDDFIPIPNNVEIPIPENHIRYDYKDKDGNLLFIILRNDKIKGFPLAYSKSQEFVLRRPTNLKTLYRAEKLSDINLKKPVLVVEGEKTAEAAALISPAAVDVVTWVGGCNGYKNGDWSLLSGRQVVLWPDADEPGRKAMDNIADILLDEGCRVFTIDTSSLEEGSDLADDINPAIRQQLFKNRKEIRRKQLSGELDIDQLLALHDKDYKYYPFGYSNMDKVVQLPPTGVVVISGRTNHGKTAFMINVALNLAKQTDLNVIFLSYEFPLVELNLRMIKTLHGVKFSDSGFEDDRIYTDHIRKRDIPAVNQYIELLKSKKLRVADAATELDEVLDLMDVMAKQGQPTCIIVDYFQVIPLPDNVHNKNRYLVLKDLVEKIRLKANTNHQLLIGGSQLTAGIDSPATDVVRESKDIENTATLHLKVWNKTKARNEKEQKYMSAIEGNFIIIVEKSRQNGANGRAFGFNSVNGCDLKPAIDEKYIKSIIEHERF